MAKKYLRGDPNIPYEKNMTKAKALSEQFTRTSHEPIYFQKIRGQWNEDVKKRYERAYSENNVKIMKKLGIHLPQRIYFYKGFGMEYEKAGFESAKQMADWMHKHGLMVSVYFGGTMFSQYFFKEVPEAEEWARKCQGGEKCTYSSYQLGRYFPCLRNPDYLDYCYKVLDYAIDEIKTDEIFFDNQILRHEPRSCRCDYCITHLNDMIKKKYTKKQCEERYGMSEYPNARPPEWSQANKPWRLLKAQQTLIQDWIDHRVEMVKDFYSDMKTYILNKRNNIAVGMNIKGIHGHNRAFNHGCDHGVVKDLFDFSCIDGYRPKYENGILQNEIRYYKAAHSNHMTIEGDFGTDIKIAELQVFNYKKHIPGHGYLGDMGDCHRVSDVSYYFREIQARLNGKEHVHEIMSLRTYPSVNYNCSNVHEQIIPMEQTLIMNHLPFGVIFDENIDEISKYRVIMLGEQEAISDKWLKALEKFIRAGGSVVATGTTGTFDAWYRKRPTHGLQRFLGHAPKAEYESKKVGKGVFVYVPKLDVHQKWNIDDWFAISGEGFQPPKNENQLLQAIQEARNDKPFTYELNAPKGLQPEAIWVKKNAELDLHMVNYGEGGLPILARVALPKGKTKATATWIDPEKKINKKIEVANGKTFVSFSFESPDIYNCARIKFS